VGIAIASDLFLARFDDGKVTFEVSKLGRQGARKLKAVRAASAPVGWRVYDLRVSEPRSSEFKRRKRVLKALERWWPFSNRQIKEQFRHPDRSIVTRLNEARDNNAVQKHIIAAGRQANELIGQKPGSSRAAGPGSPFGAGFIVADESKNSECPEQPRTLICPSGHTGVERTNH
jgi:hypothetical protein